MSEGAEAKRHLTLELGDLEETLVSTKRNGRWGKLQNNIKNTSIGNEILPNNLNV